MMDIIMAEEKKMEETLGEGGDRKVPDTESRDKIQGVVKPSRGRLARRAEGKRMSTRNYELTRQLVRDFLQDVIRDAITQSQLDKGNRVTAFDVRCALLRQRQGFLDMNKLELPWGTI